MSTKWAQSSSWRLAHIDSTQPSRAAGSHGETPGGSIEWRQWKARASSAIAARESPRPSSNGHAAADGAVRPRVLRHPGVPKTRGQPPKQDVAQALLLSGSAFVYLDPRRDGVVVPPHLRKQAQLVLQIGLDLVVPIPDLTVDDDGIRGTLSFNRAPFTCIVPWSAVFALVGDDAMGVVWHEDLPEEIAAEVADAEQRAEANKPRPALRAIEGGASGEGDALSAEDAAKPDEPEPEGPAKPTRSHLRLVE